MHTNSVTSRKIETVTLDTQFLQKIAFMPLQQNSSGPQSIKQLGNFLRIRNSKYSYTKKTREGGQEWIKKKGGNLEPLLDKVKMMKDQQAKKEEEKKAQIDCYFYLPEMSLKNVQTYMNKNFQYGLFNTMQSIMSTQKSKGNLVKKILQRKKNRLYLSSEVELPVINTQSRKKQKKELYIQATKDILKSFKSPTALEFVEGYKSKIKEKFWEIMYNHLIVIPQRGSKTNSMSRVLLSSLKMVEAEFNSSLPHSYESLLYYITNNYLNKLKGSYLRDDNFGPIWAIAFFNYRAGRKEEFYRCLGSDESLRTTFMECDKSIRDLRPKMSSVMNETEDVFHRQLIYALKGIGQYSDDAICDPNTLDIVWIFLRNVGIFGQLQKFNELKEDLYQSYSKFSMNQTKIKNLFFLAAYPEIVEVGQNQIMDQDDFLHFLIALVHSDELMQENETMIRKKLTEQIIIYISELMLENREDYIMYMLLMPEEDVPNQMSSIISSSQLLDTLKWDKFQEHFSAETFANLAKQTLIKYAEQNHNYVLVAEKYCQLLKEDQPAIQFLLDMMIKSVVMGKVEQNQLKKAERLVETIFYRNPQLQIEYKSVFRIFSENRILTEANINRDTKQIVKKLSQCEHLLVTEQLTLATTSALQKLIERNGFEVYIIYLRNVVKAYELTLISEKKLKELQELQLLTLNSLNQLLKREPYYRFAEKECVIDLLNHLEQKLYVK